MGNFEVYGDQKTLTQWDVGRKVAVAQKCDYIHFANAAMSEAVACKVREDDGLWIAEIPDEVLQVSGVLRIYAFVVTAGENYTKYSQNLFIRARPKPDNYLYTPTTGVSWEAMIGRVEELEEKTAQKPVYTAEEVGARPDTWMPTADDVGARPNTWLPTIADIGAAPAGYGLGGNLTKITADDINTLHNGWYRIVDTSITVAGWTASDWYIHVIRYAETYCIQHWYPLSAQKMEIIRWRVAGTWYEEWVNPPMQLGTEYRTTERYNGKPVYVKCVNIGALPNASRATLNTITAVGRETIISATGIATNGSDARPFPYRAGATTSGYGDVDLAVRTTGTQSITGYIGTTVDMSAFTGVLTLKYTKSTD